MHHQILETLKTISLYIVASEVLVLVGLVVLIKVKCKEIIEDEPEQGEEYDVTSDNKSIEILLPRSFHGPVILINN